MMEKNKIDMPPKVSSFREEEESNVKAKAKAKVKAKAKPIIPKI